MGRRRQLVVAEPGDNGEVIEESVQHSAAVVVERNLTDVGKAESFVQGHSAAIAGLQRIRTPGFPACFIEDPPQRTESHEGGGIELVGSDTGFQTRIARLHYVTLPATGHYPRFMNGRTAHQPSNGADPT